MDPRIFSRLVVAGGAVLALGVFVVVMTPWAYPVGFSLMFAGPILAIVAFVGYVMARRTSGPVAEIQPRPVWMAWSGTALLCVALIALGLLTTVGPRTIHGPSASCQGTDSLSYPKGALISVRPPQLMEDERRYDATNDTTLLVAGCDHTGYDFALRVRGNHAGPERPERLLLAPEAFPAPSGFIPLNASEAPRVARATEAVFVVRSIMPLLAFNAFPILAAGAGTSLLALVPWRRAAAAASGSFAGMGFAAFRLYAGPDLIDFIIFFPAALGLMIWGATLVLGTSRAANRRAVGVALILVGISGIVFYMRLVDAFPTTPTA